MSGLFDGSPRLTRLLLPAALREALVDHAQATPDVEVCGLIGGRGDAATSLYPLVNVADEPATSFFIEPRGQIRALLAMRARGEALVGIFHSHPRTAAEPSVRDRALAAYPGVAYLIVSLAGRGMPVVGGFVFEDGDFAPLPLVAA